MTIQQIAKMTHEERISRRDEKRAEVLKATRRIGWINTEAASELLGVTRPAASRTLKGLTADALLCLHQLPGLPKRIWYSITETGMDEALFLENLPLTSTIQAGRWKIAPQNYLHEQDVLIFSVKARKVGAEIRLAETEDGRGRALSGKYPDLLVTASGQTFGIEIEREVKSRRRYKEIIASHWRAMERQKYHKVLYLSPDTATRDRLKRIMNSVFEGVRIGGRDRPLTEQEQIRFGFATIDQGVNFIKKIMEREA